MKVVNSSAVALALMLVLCTVVSPEPSGSKTVRVYFGTTAKGKDAGIWSSVLNVTTGKLTEPQLVAESRATRILAMGPAGKFLFASGKPDLGKRDRNGHVSAFRVDPATGKLTYLNAQPSAGVGLCYLQVDRTGRALLVAHYRGGSCAMLPIKEDGSLKPVSVLKEHAGSSVHPKRQTTPHPHAIVLDPAGRFAFVPDLGLDQVLIYRLDAKAGTLVPTKPAFVRVDAGGGPRHFAFHPTSRFAYVNLELTSKVTAFRYDAKSGALKPVQTVSTLPKEASGKNATAGICVTPDGRFLYVTNRGHNTIAIFAVDLEKGTLTPRGHESTRGDVPQTLAIDPTGRCLLVTDRNAGRARVFVIDPKTGQLKHTQSLELARVGTVAFRALD
jgi:6-phosphogluconolactonase